jgi:hypothetical protein
MSVMVFNGVVEALHIEFQKAVIYFIKKSLMLIYLDRQIKKSNSRF